MTRPPAVVAVPLLAAAVLGVLRPADVAGGDAGLPGGFSGYLPIEWSVRMAGAQVSRLGDSLEWKEGGTAQWDYAAGLFVHSLLVLDGRVNWQPFEQFAENAIGSFILPDGAIRDYSPREFSLDNLNSGRAALELFQITKEDRYYRAVWNLRRQLDFQPRTRDGGFWHKARYPNQIWLDGIYMAEPFQAAFARLASRPADFDDVAKQIQLADTHLYDPRAKLFYHGWDETRRQPWANKTTGTSSNFWARSMGWYGMALVDVLDYFPPDHPARPDIIATLQKFAAGVVKYQDPKTGLWYQVVDQGARKGNYLEASASSMFVYALAKAINRGYISSEYTSAVLDGYRGITERLVQTNGLGQISLTHCCAVAALGAGRDGSFAYYVSEPVVENDNKGVGPFILAGIELEDLCGLPSAVPHSEISQLTSAAAAPTAGWAAESEILARIGAPEFPNRQFPITNYGAAGGGLVDCTEAIAKAIAACSKTGGGHVVVPPGVFLTGPIHLLSGVDLHLDADATLRFTTNSRAYLPAVATRYEGVECFNYSPFIYAYHQQDIAITGGGFLDGQAGAENWWSWAGGRGGPDATNQPSAWPRLNAMCNQDVSVFDRVFGEGDGLRPDFIQVHGCKNVLIEGVHIRRSPMWEIHPLLCTNVIVRGVDIVSHGPNNDGCDPECSRDVLIENCAFDTGGDCIAIKSGRNDDGRRLGLPSANLVIRNCAMKDGQAGVAIGSEISGGCSNVFVEACVMDSPRLDRVLRLKSNAMRGGTIENVFVRDVQVGTVADAVLQIDFLYDEGAAGPYKPAARNVVMENITAEHTPRVLNVAGFPGGEISGVRVIHSTFHDVQRPDSIQNAGDVKEVDCVVEKAQ
jgi:unsaturated rhamnogalacturonyl hydrolase